MMDPASRAALQNFIRRESRSLLQYVCESFPWITSMEQEALARLNQIAREELEGTAVSARFLAKYRISPTPLGPYPMTYTNINYMSLDHLLPILVEFQKQRITDLENDLSHVTETEARRHLETYLAMKRAHLRQLEDLAKEVGTKQAAASVP